MVKRGDTLIEVTLAVGIFSMIAIAIAAVMSSGTSNAQTALETTLAREEIDTQAEALRFIHSAYVADRKTKTETYQKLWDNITKNAIEVKNEEGFLNYHPQNCADLYKEGDGEIYTHKAFIINPRILNSDNPSNAFVSAVSLEGEDKFSQASTYPRLIFGKDEEVSLASSELSDNLYRAEGVYIIAVKDKDTTIINNKKTSAFYDFYIRTCWYGAGSDQASAISTVIRLYNPNVSTE